MERFARLAADSLNHVLKAKITPTDLESPPDPQLGDFGYPCFRLAKEYGKAPPMVAQQLVAEIKAKHAIPAGFEVAAVGPYVNFTVPADLVLSTLLKDILHGGGLGDYAKAPDDQRGTWVLEYSSPNVAKPFQFYHLRPTTLGATLDRIGRYRGFKVVSINHLGDWGTQYGKLAVALKMFGADLPADPSIKDLVDIYVKFHTEAEKRPELEDEARAAFKKLEQNDPEMTAIWKKCCDISLQEFHRIYARIGVKFDHIWGESFYTKHMPEVLEGLKARGLLVESEGAQVVHVTDREGKELPPCILLKSDGATIYATRDVAAAIYRYGQFKFDRMTYIVGGEQRLHFQQVFGVLRKMGMEWESKCEHVPTGLYRFNEAKMSTRKGNYFTLEDVIDLARARVETLMKDRAQAQEMPLPEGFADIVEKVAVGAVIFNDLSTDPARNVEFDLERIVDFEGETGPYLQYAHTRCLSIIRKAKETGEWPKELSGDVSQLKKPEELALVKLLGQFSLHLERTLKHAKASQLASFLIDVTKAYGAFYRECKVLGEAPELTRARLLLVEATRRILGRGMELLGMPLPERM